MKVQSIDLSTALKIKGLLNTIRNVGFLLGSMLLFSAIAERRLLIVVAVVFVASALLARGSRAAALVLMLCAVMMTVFFERDYRRAMARREDPPTLEIQDPALRAATERALDSLAGTSRDLAWVSAVSGVFYLGALVLAAVYRRLTRRPRPELAWYRRLLLEASFLRARATPAAVRNFALALACALFVLAPALLMMFGLLLGVPHGTVVAIDWAYDLEYGFWHVVSTFAGVIGCLYFLVRAKLHAGITITDARTLDPRPPILLLRSFADDTTPLERNRDQNSWKRSLLMPTVWTLEETIEQVLGQRGPVIAIGRPGEPVPPAGAAREYLGNDVWQDRVRELIEHARLVVVILGDTEGLRFEYQTLLGQGAGPKLILLFPPRPLDELLSRWHRFCEVLAPGAATEIDLDRAMAARLVAGDTVTVVGAHRRDDEDCYRIALDYCLAQAPSAR